MIKYIRKKGRSKNFVWENEDYSNGIYTIEKKNFGNKSWLMKDSEKYFTASWYKDNKYQVIEKFFTKQEAIDFLNQIFLQNKERANV